MSKAQTLAIPLGDGSVHQGRLLLPKGAGPWPLILVQTPYGKEHLPPLLFSSWKRLAVLVVDWKRGPRGLPTQLEQARHGHGLLAWAARQPWCNGCTGTFGASALGAIQFRTAATGPPSLVCCLPLVATPGWNHATFYRGGVLQEELVATLEELGFPVRHIVEAHPLEDAFWDLATAPEIPAMGAPCLLVAGWFDPHLEGTLKSFTRLTQASNSPCASQHRLLIGPWTHRGFWSDRQGELVFPGAASLLRQATAAWFRRHLEQGPAPQPDPPIRYWEHGRPPLKSAWNWPPDGSLEEPWQLQHGGGLLPQPAPSKAPLGSFDHDPKNPVPSVGGANLSARLKSGPRDQRLLVESRPDVLVFETGPLDQPLEIAGLVNLRLRVSSTARDPQLVARLTEVAREGPSRLLCDGILRLALRNGFRKPEPILPGRIHEAVMPLSDLAMHWRRGTALRLTLCGSSSPRYAVAAEPCRTTIHPGTALLLPLTRAHRRDHGPESSAR